MKKEIRFNKKELIEELVKTLSQIKDYLIRDSVNNSGIGHVEVIADIEHAISEAEGR